MLGSWQQSQYYWLLAATLTNVITIALLIILFRREGKTFWNLFRVHKAHLRKDILIFIGLTLLAVPAVLLPGHLLSIWLWGDASASVKLMFGSIPNVLVYVLLVAFPVTIAFAELPFYFGYIMPKLAERQKSKWIAVILPLLFLSLQHVTLPFVADIDFIIYRAIAYLPLALLIGISLYYRPSLFLFFVILHGLMDLGAVAMFLFQNQ